MEGEINTTPIKTKRTRRPSINPRKKPDKYQYHKPKKPNGKEPTGRPSTYKPEYCQSLIDFMQTEHKQIVVDTTYYKVPDQVLKNEQEKGASLEDISGIPGPLKSTTNKEITNRFPTFQRRCHEIGIVYSTLLNRTIEHKEFLEAFTRARQIQEAILLENVMQGKYNPQFGMFIAKNNFGYKDKSEVATVTVDSKDLTPEQRAKLLDRLKLDENE